MKLKQFIRYTNGRSRFSEIEVAIEGEKICPLDGSFIDGRTVVEKDRLDQALIIPTHSKMQPLIIFSLSLDELSMKLIIEEKAKEIAKETKRRIDRERARAYRKSEKYKLTQERYWKKRGTRPLYPRGGSYFLQLRTMYGYTRSQVERLTGVKKETLRAIEKGTNKPRPERLKVLADFYEVPVSVIEEKYREDRI